MTATNPNTCHWFSVMVVTGRGGGGIHSEQRDQTTSATFSCEENKLYREGTATQYILAPGDSLSDVLTLTFTTE